MQSCVLLVVVVLVLEAVVSALPTPTRYRHQHFRRRLDDVDQIVQEVEELSQDIRSLQRRRRQSDKLDVKDGASLGVCPYSVTPNIGESRIPKVIEEVVCKKTSGDCKCGGENSGLYRCTQLTSTMKVFYTDTKTTIDYQYNSGCICAAPRGSHVEPTPHMSE